jgi:3-(3-hydroxy-phenyl)propionate hydroxylase
MKYKPKPRFHRGFLLPQPSAPKDSLLGRLFPQALVMTAAGVKLLDDVLGDGFALVAPPGVPAQTLSDTPANSETTLKLRAVVVLDKEDASAVAPPAIAARDYRGELARLLAGQPTGLYLLRPDRYVAAFFPLAEIASAGDAIEQLIRSTRAA